MSYDFTFFRLKHPISSYRDVDANVVADLGSMTDIRTWITKCFPSILWSNSENIVWGVLECNGEHLEFLLAEAESLHVSSFRVKTSYHQGSRRLIEAIADTLCLTVFDMQTCDLYPPGGEAQIHEGLQICR